MAKYPNGGTQAALGWMLEPPPKRDMEKLVIQYLNEPNVLLICRTDRDGRIARAIRMPCILDLERGRPNLKVWLPGRMRPRWRTIDLV